MLTSTRVLRGLGVVLVVPNVLVLIAFSISKPLTSAPTVYRAVSAAC